MIRIKAIRDCADPRAYTRGNQLYKKGMVEEFHAWKKGENLEAEASVEGSYGNEYSVSMTYDRRKEVFSDFYCECPAYHSYAGMCKHCVAVALEFMEWSENQKEEVLHQYVQKESQSGKLNGMPVDGAAKVASDAADKVISKALGEAAKKVPGRVSGKAPEKVIQPDTDTAVTKLIFASSIQEKARYFQPEVTGNVSLTPILHHTGEGWNVEFKIGVGNLYVLRDITAMISAVKEGKWVSYGQKLAFYHEKSAFTAESRRLIDFLENCVDGEQEFIQEMWMVRRAWAPTMASTRYLMLPAERMVGFALAVGEGTIKLESCIKEETELKIVQSDPVLTFELADKRNGGWRFTAPRGETFVGNKRMCVCEGNTLYVCSEAFAEHMRAACRLMEPYRKQEYHINGEDLPAFCSSVLPNLEAYCVLKKPDTLEQYLPKPCVITVYLDYVEKNLTAIIYSVYGEVRHNLTEGLEMKDLYRDIEKEQAVVKLAENYFSNIDPKMHLLFIPKDEEDRQYRMLSTGIAQFRQLGEVYISDALKRLKVLKAPRITMGVALRGGLLDITLQTDRLEAGELEALLTSYRKRKKYYRLNNGDFLELEDNSMAAVAELAEGLSLNTKELEEGHIQVPEYRGFYLDQVLKENEGELTIKRSQSYKAFLRSMKNVEDSDYDIPDGLNAELRPYQNFGFRWLMTLSDLGFGGILADDMGLGKTVQAIAYLVAQKERLESAAGARSLIVCPASLVYNWESEIQRFAPGLTVDMVVGNAEARKTKIENSKADILLTSYDLLKRDTKIYEGIHFSAMLIDEAQNIKNHMTQAAKAVKSISCEKRFALTGTPIENTLSELWSIFDFLMPGFLDSYKHFKERYEQPVVAKQDEVVTKRLRRMIRPFIMRRLKKDVLKELPDKMEEVVYSRMEQEQRDIYEARVQRLLDFLSGQSQEEFRVGKLQILAELTHLRQLCCDPSLVYENYKGGAAKVDTCVELVKNAVEAGNKLLLFSQFTTMLDIIKKRLEEEGIGYYLLTGATSKEKRSELVRSFNQNDTPVFLISLKAGGTGLNLTAASIVIHFDPWWNQAAQNQATDRTHRIGQQQVVTVYKLIMKDTLEEKILEMQEKKAGLSEEIIADGSISSVIGSKEEFMEILRGAAQ